MVIINYFVCCESGSTAITMASAADLGAAFDLARIKYAVIVTVATRALHSNPLGVTTEYSGRPSYALLILRRLAEYSRTSEYLTLRPA